MDNVIVKKMPVSKVHGGENARRDFDPAELEDLANSLRDSGGVLQPVLGYLMDDGESVELISGERRLRAMQAAGYTEIEVKLVEKPARKDALKWNLVENIQRSNLRPLEAARRVKDLIDLVDPETGMPVWNRAGLAEELGKSSNWVKECIFALDCPEGGIEALESGKIDLSVAALIGSLPAALRDRAVEEIVNPTFGVAMTRDQARRHSAEHYRRDLRQAKFDRDDADLAAELPACAECPWCGANRSDLEGKIKRYLCLNPVCYDRKTAVSARRETQGADADAGPAPEAAQDQGADAYFDRETDYVKPDCGCVDERERAHLWLMSEAGKAIPREKFPRWDEVVGDIAPRIEVTDHQGRVRRLIRLDLATAAAGMGSHAHLFRSGADEGLRTEEDRKTDARVRRAMQTASEQVRWEGLGELIQDANRDGALGCGVPDDMTRAAQIALLESIIEEGMQRADVEWLCCALDPTSPIKAGMPMDTLRELIDRLLPDAGQVFGLVAAAARIRAVRYEGFSANEDGGAWDRFCRAIEFDAAKWRKKEAAAVARAEKAARKAK